MSASTETQFLAPALTRNVCALHQGLDFLAIYIFSNVFLNLNSYFGIKQILVPWKKTTNEELSGGFCMLFYSLF